MLDESGLGSAPGCFGSLMEMRFLCSCTMFRACNTTTARWEVSPRTRQVASPRGGQCGGYSLGQRSLSGPPSRFAAGGSRIPGKLAGPDRRVDHRLGRLHGGCGWILRFCGAYGWWLAGVDDLDCLLCRIHRAVLARRWQLRAAAQPHCRGSAGYEAARSPASAATCIPRVACAACHDHLDRSAWSSRSCRGHSRDQTTLTPS
jgi:hypothetical protein